MFCSGCGQGISPGQAACPTCGRPIPAQVFAAQFGSRVHRHAHTLAFLWIAYAIYNALGWFIAMPILSSFFGWGWHHGGMFGPHFFPGWPWLVPFVSTVVVARTALALGTGIGLLRRAPWARTLAIVAGFLTLIKPILGTALGIYTLWVFLPATSDREYQEMVVPSRL